MYLLHLLLLLTACLTTKLTLPPRDKTYNFIKKSLKYDTKNKYQIILLNNFMNDVLSYKSLNQWSNILKCHSNDLPKSLLCYSCITDYYIAIEHMQKANETILEGFEYLKSSKNGISSKTFENPKKIFIQIFFFFYLEPCQRCEEYIHAFYNWVALSNLDVAYSYFYSISIKHPKDLYAIKRGQLMSLYLGKSQNILNIINDVLEIHIFTHIQEVFHLNF
jgi:hypothetical protein